MSDHLADVMLNALADGELTAEELTAAHAHLAECAACTSNALQKSLLKAATARVGQRYALPVGLRERMAQLIPENALQVRPERKTSLEWKYAGWAAAALISIAGSFVLERGVLRNQLASATNAALATEVCDEHIAMLAGGGIPQVVSTDRHTVKPWFQGKIPFSFNLPASLPSDIVLDGANLAYLHNRPAAQLLYSIGHHHVSVFLQEKDGESGTISAEHAGFHVAEVSSGGLEAVAVSDVDSARLWELVRAVGAAQTASHH